MESLREENTWMFSLSRGVTGSPSLMTSRGFEL